MSWYDIDRYVVGQPIAAADLNELRDSITELRDVKKVYYIHDGSGSDWTSTAGLGEFAPIDSTKFRLTLRTGGGPVIVMFYGTMQRPTDGVIHLAIHREGDINDPLREQQQNYATTWRSMLITKPYINLPAGEHTFTMYWRLVGGSAVNAAVLNAAMKPYMLVAESF